MLPELEPRTVSQRFIVPSICSRDVACAEWSNVRSFEHFLKLLDVVNCAFNVHGSPSSRRKPDGSNRRVIGVSLSDSSSVIQSASPATSPADTKALEASVSQRRISHRASNWPKNPFSAPPSLASAVLLGRVEVSVPPCSNVL